MVYGENIRRLRKEKGLSQRKLAIELNVTHVAIHNFEKEKRQPSIEMLERLAEILETTPAKLVGWDD